MAHNLAGSVPGPIKSSETFVEISIQNGALGIYPLGYGVFGYWNLPATRHGYGCNLSFADGHAESWRWIDPYIGRAAESLRQRPPAPGDSPAQPSVPADRDLLKLRQTVPR